jgi:F0F1-type ATP synthase assembly protein I
LSGEDKPESGESGSPKESGVDRVRAERQRRREAEPGYRTGQAIGEHLRRSSLIVLPIEMALGPVLLALAGWWLDRRYGTSPWFVIIGVVAGLSLAIQAVIRTIKEVSK